MRTVVAALIALGACSPGERSAAMPDADVVTVTSFHQHPSFAGRFAVTTPGWQLDFSIELTAQYGVSCTLL